MSDPSYTGRQLDDRAVRVLAHPLRSRLLSRLRLAWPANDAVLAAALSTTTDATSYHLRALKSVGLVTNSGEGVGKRRLSRASTKCHSWTNSGLRNDDDDTPT